MSEAEIGHLAGLSPAQRFPNWLSDELRDNRIIYVVVFIFLASAIGTSATRGDAFLPMLGVYLERVVRALALIGSAGFVLTSVQVLRRGSQRPSREIMREMVALVASPRMARLLFSLAVLALFMAAFLYKKTLIPQIRPFDWDATFAAWDLALFGGVHPWEWLHPVLGHPAVTFGLDAIYSSWVPAVFVVWGWTCASRRVPAELRRHYWLATLLCWILIGVAMATYLSSAGPCFLPQIAPALAVEYAGLNGYLATVSETVTLTSSLAKQFLWASHTGLISEPAGISAMPSMHNAQAVLFVLLGFRISRGLGFAMSAYALFIFLGSIHLAWHYAVDGLIGGAAAAAIWYFVGYALPPVSSGRAR